MGKNAKSTNTTITYEKELIKEIFRTAANVSLYTIYFFIKYIGHEILSGTPKSVYRALRQSEEFAASVSWEQFKQSFFYIKSRGDLKVITKKGVKELQITEQGKKRLESIIPTYHEQRDWDEKLYLITYDIPATHNHQRDLIRDAIYRLAGGKLQDSVYVTPYNPRKSLHEFIEENHIQGDILVSDLGADGSIAGKTIRQIVAEVYPLDKLNDRYRAYLKKFAQIQHTTQRRGDIQFVPKQNIGPFLAELEFISILRDDPQLPFPLLPDYWLSSHAHQLYQKITISNLK